MATRERDNSPAKKNMGGPSSDNERASGERINHSPVIERVINDNHQESNSITPNNPPSTIELPVRVVRMATKRRQG